MEVVLDLAVRRGVDLVLIQEPRGEKEKDGTRSHSNLTFIRGEDGVPLKCWIAVNRAPRCRVTELKELTRACENHILVVEVALPGVGEPIIIANVYDRHRGSAASRPAQWAAWGEITQPKCVIIARDMKAHSKLWNPETTRPRNHSFRERLIQEDALIVWTSEEVTWTGLGATIHSIIDQTLSSPNIELEWSLLRGEAMGSDHELITWNVLEQLPPRADTSTETTG